MIKTQKAWIIRTTGVTWTHTHTHPHTLTQTRPRLHERYLNTCHEHTGVKVGTETPSQISSQNIFSPKVTIVSSLTGLRLTRLQHTWCLGHEEINMPQCCCCFSGVHDFLFSVCTCADVKVHAYFFQVLLEYFRKKKRKRVHTNRPSTTDFPLISFPLSQWNELKTEKSGLLVTGVEPSRVSLICI